MSKEIVIFTVGLIIALFIGLTIGWATTTYTEEYNGICWFDVYDEHLTGISIKVYNFSYPAGGIWDSDCEALKDICLLQGPNVIDKMIDGQLTIGTNIPCNWIEPNKCECYPYKR